jgi:hypothetical protein
MTVKQSLPNHAACDRIGLRFAKTLGCHEEVNMATTIAEMTRDELREMIETSVEQKLLELLGDPDEGLELRKTVRDRLVRQQKAVAKGEHGTLFDEAVRQLGLE